MEDGETDQIKPLFSNMGWGADIKTFQQKGLPTPDSTLSIILKGFDLADIAPDPFLWENFSNALGDTWEGLQRRRPDRRIKGWIRADWEGNGVAISLPEEPQSLRAFIKNLPEFLLANHETLKTNTVTITPGPNAEIQSEII
jgi:hypothetical protein